jgi:hypothetical protein
VGDDIHGVFCQRILGENGSVRWCVVVMQQPVLLPLRLRTKTSHIFTQSPQNVTVVCGIDCLVCQGDFLANNPLNVKENDEHVLCSSHVSPFSV